MECDFLIIGQGIAGSTLALELMKRGSKVLVVDRGDPGSSSRVAAGLVTPLTGKGLNAAWRQREYLPIAEQFYRDLEKRTGEKVYYTTEVRRLLRTEAEETKWQKKVETHAEWGSLVETSKDDLDLGHGVISMPRGAWLDTKKLIEVIVLKHIRDIRVFDYLLGHDDDHRDHHEKRFFLVRIYAQYVRHYAGQAQPAQALWPIKPIPL